jgi:hypothetical protein
MDPDIVKFFGVMITLCIAGVTAYAGFSMVNLITHWLERRGGKDPVDLEYLKDRMAQVDGLEERVAELETRLDFAERLLTAPKDRSEVSPDRDL